LLNDLCFLSTIILQPLAITFNKRCDICHHYAGKSLRVYATTAAAAAANDDDDVIVDVQSINGADVDSATST